MADGEAKGELTAEALEEGESKGEATDEVPGDGEAGNAALEAEHEATNSDVASAAQGRM